MSSSSAMAFEEVVENYSDFVYNLAYRILGNSADSENFRIVP